MATLRPSRPAPTALAPFVPGPVARMAAALALEAPEPAFLGGDGVVLFGDISGFTALTERLAREGAEGAEVLSEILESVFERGPWSRPVSPEAAFIECGPLPDRHPPRRRAHSGTRGRGRRGGLCVILTRSVSSTSRARHGRTATGGGDAESVKRVLVSNPGEIAIRIAKAASAPGMESVGVYAPVDALSLHARVATEALEIGVPAGDPVAAYLDAEALI